MGGRPFFIIISFILMTYITFDLPFIFGSKVELVENNKATLESEEISSQIDELLKKPYLNEQESKKYDILVERKINLHKQNINAEKIDIFDDEIYVQIRKSKIFLLSIIWLVFLIFVPKKMFEFIGLLVFPLIMTFFQVIILEEMLMILGLTVMVAVAKTRINRVKVD